MTRVLKRQRCFEAGARQLMSVAAIVEPHRAVFHSTALFLEFHVPSSASAEHGLALRSRCGSGAVAHT